MYTIRPYSSHDAHQLLPCICELQDFERTLEPDRVPGSTIAERYLQELLATITSGQGQIFVAIVQENIVGFIAIRQEHEHDTYLSTLTDYAYISDSVVLAPYRCQGIGTALLDTAQDYARQQGIHTLKIQVLARNQRARQVYLSDGFREHEITLIKHLLTD